MEDHRHLHALWMLWMIRGSWLQALEHQASAGNFFGIAGIIRIIEGFHSLVHLYFSAKPKTNELVCLLTNKTCTSIDSLKNCTLGQKHTFYPKIPGFGYYKKCDFWLKLVPSLWILWKMIFSECEFCQKWYFQNVNFVKNETFKMWIL